MSVQAPFNKAGTSIQHGSLSLLDWAQLNGAGNRPPLMKPTYIIDREERYLSKGRFEYVYITDAGEFTLAELASIFGVVAETMRARIARHGYESKRVFCDKGTYAGFNESLEWGNDEWKALSDEERGGQEDIKISAYERTVPDPYDEEKARKYDRERYGK